MVLRGFIAAWIAVAIMSASAPARADAAEVEALIAKGNELRRAGTPGPALPYFQKAYELARTPRTSGQLGLAELAAGYPVEAAEHLAAALETPNDPSIVKYRPMLADALTMARAQIGELTIKGSPPGAEVTVNGRNVGALPLPSAIKLPARNVEIIVRAPDHADQRQIVPIAGGQRHEVTVNLTRLAKAEPPKKTEPNTSGADGPGKGGVTGGTLQASGTASSSGVRTAAWIAGGGAVVAAGTGLALQLVARSNLSDFNGSCKNDAVMGIVTTSGGHLTAAECQDRYDAWQSDRRWSLVGYAAGAALAVTSGVLFWLSQPTSPATATPVGLQCGPSPNGISCLGVF